MREIKFRAKRIGNNEWVTGEPHIQCCRPHIHTGEAKTYLIDKETLGQFTGLRDKNGKEIYEEDIVKFHFMSSSPYSSELFPTEKFYGVITTNKYNQWTILSDGLEIHIENAIKYGEIVGNIHDNPELIKED